MNFSRCYLYLTIIFVLVTVHGRTKTQWKLIETGRKIILIGIRPQDQFVRCVSFLRTHGVSQSITHSFMLGLPSLQPIKYVRYPYTTPTQAVTHFDIICQTLVLCQNINNTGCLKKRIIGFCAMSPQLLKP